MDVHGFISVYHHDKEDKNEPNAVNSFELIQSLSPMPGFKGPVKAVALTPPTSKMPRALFVCSDRMYCYQRKVLPIHETVFTSFYNPEFKGIVTASSNRICVWDGTSGSLLREFHSRDIFGINTLSSLTKEITSCCLDSTGRRLIVGDETGCVKVVNFVDGSVKKEFDPHNGAVAYVDYSFDDKCAVTAGVDGHVHIVDDAELEGYKKANTEKGFHEHEVVTRSIMINASEQTLSLGHKVRSCEERSDELRRHISGMLM